MEQQQQISEHPAPKGKILMCSFACNPYQGSEPGMGWNFVRAVAQEYEVHVIVALEFKEQIDRYFAEHPEEKRNMSFYYIERFRCLWLHRIWPPSYYWDYRRWHRDVLALAEELEKKENFDIVHMVTLSGYREPGYLWKLGKPFIWGPIGGLTDSPWCLLPCLGLKGGLFLTARNIWNKVQKRYGSAARAAAEHAHTILTSTVSAVADIKRFWHRDSILMHEVGYEPRHATFPPTPHEPGTPLRVCWAGEHVSRKALDLLLRALPQCKEDIEVHVLNQGKCTEGWKKLAKKMKVEDRVMFHGRVPWEDVFRIMGSCHVFCLTSLREETSTVVFEAFRYGLPIVAPDHCGFASVINENCGIKIPIHSAAQVLSDYARHLDYLATHEEERARLSAGALARCMDYTWEAKLTELNKVYAAAMGQKD